MKAYEAMIAWTPAYYQGDLTVGQVEVGPLVKEGDPDWTKSYRFTGGAAFASRHGARGAESLAYLFIDFHTLVVRDGIEFSKVHEAFLAIDEYRAAISPEIPGSENKSTF